MNGREMFRQMTKRQTNLQTQARQPNKQMVESAGRRSLPKLSKKSSLNSNGNNGKDRQRPAKTIQFVSVYSVRTPKQNM